MAAHGIDVAPGTLDGIRHLQSIPAGRGIKNVDGAYREIDGKRLPTPIIDALLDCMNMRGVRPQSHALIALRDCDHPVNAPDTDSLDLAGLVPLLIAGRDLFQGPRLRRLARSHAVVARLKHDGSAADDE
jgi:hypothetical protein